MTKPFKSVTDQVVILEARGLSFKDKAQAMKILERYGYYEIINGYKDPFLESSNPEKYIYEACFEDIYALYSFDAALRDYTLVTMLNIERNLRAIVSYTIAETFGHLESDYLKRSNYKDGKKYKDGYKLDQLLLKFKKIIHDDTQPFKHYKQAHGNCPPWILVKGMTFGNLINFIKLQKSEIKSRIIARCYGVEESSITEELKTFFMESMYLFLAYRNRCAHSGRIYNYKSSKAKVSFCAPIHTKRKINEAKYRQGFGKNDWNALQLALSLFDDKTPAKLFDQNLKNLLLKYSHIFPDSNDFLTQEMKLLPEQIQAILKDIQ
ncbi:Abi family protein [Abiotrophia defectiva]|uniref:Abi family protein n=1 Tax=Abiotrophia defectiva TaxID=46125 RepID=UPI0028D1B710|nr:Abi family protein [Abiotrophia defectiva]